MPTKAWMTLHNHGTPARLWPQRRDRQGATTVSAQLALAYAALANGGTPVNRSLRAVETSNGTAVQEFSPACAGRSA
jgi:hypothetical protein